jgi:hypothetical protein
LPLIIEAGITLLTAIIGALPDIIVTIVDALPEIIKGIVGGLIGALPELTQAGWQLLMGLLDGIFKAVPELLKGVGNVIKSLINSVLELFGIHSPSTVFADIGKNLLEGLWQGILNVKDWLIDKIRGLGHLVTDALKAVLGIHSPSSVFRDQIGKNMALGLGEGFSAEMERVSQDMLGAVPLSFEARYGMDASLRGAANLGSGGDSGGDMNFYFGDVHIGEATPQAARDFIRRVSEGLAAEQRRRALA